MTTSTFCFPSAVFAITWKIFANWERFPSWSFTASSEEITQSILKSCNIHEYIFVCIAAAGRECDIPLAPPVMQLHFKNLLHRFSSFRFTTYTRTAGFRVSESTNFLSRRAPKSACSVGNSKCLLSHRSPPLSRPRSQKV